MGFKSTSTLGNLQMSFYFSKNMLRGCVKQNSPPQPQSSFLCLDLSWGSTHWQRTSNYFLFFKAIRQFVHYSYFHNNWGGHKFSKPSTSLAVIGSCQQTFGQVGRGKTHADWPRRRNGGFHNGVPQNGWFITENPTKVKNGWFRGTPIRVL